MNQDFFTLNTFIINSTHEDYQENKNKKLMIKKKIFEGSYGMIFLLNNDHVIKIFKNSTQNNTILDESNYLLPLVNENRELIFFYKYKNDNADKNFIISLYCIGILKDIIIDKDIKLDVNSYFVILPYCIPFYEIFNVYNLSLLNYKNGITFSLNVMKRLIEISEFFKKKYDLVNLDFKLNNFMFDKKINNLNNLIMIDFGIIKKKNKKKYDIIDKYYIWPDSNNIQLSYLQSYSICINGLELLFGKDQVINLPNIIKINSFLNILKKTNKSLYKIFYNGLITKINIKKLLILINKVE